MPINILALLYGGLMLMNIAIWQRPEPVRRLRRRGRAYRNPIINGFLNGSASARGLPAWPLFETLVGTLLLFGAIYYLVSVRGRAADVEADAVTGEATIG